MQLLHPLHLRGSVFLNLGEYTHTWTLRAHDEEIEALPGTGLVGISAVMVVMNWDALGTAHTEGLRWEIWPSHGSSGLASYSSRIVFARRSPYRKIGRDCVGHFYNLSVKHSVSNPADFFFFRYANILPILLFFRKKQYLLFYKRKRHYYYLQVNRFFFDIFNSHFLFFIS